MKMKMKVKMLRLERKKMKNKLLIEFIEKDKDRFYNKEFSRKK